jgi:hypothetical protein
MTFNNGEKKGIEIKCILDAPNESLIFENINDYNRFYDSEHNFPYSEYSISGLNIDEKTIYFCVKINECFFVKNLNISNSIYSSIHYYYITTDAWVFKSPSEIYNYFKNPTQYYFKDISNINGNILHLCYEIPSNNCKVNLIEPLNKSKIEKNYIL